MFVLIGFSRISCGKKEQKKSDFGLVIHGGAGSMERGVFTPEQEQAYKDKLTEALNTGYEILKNGGTGVECVEKVINVMEDSPLFNSGKGAVLTNAGTAELDASIMDGSDLNSGAGAGVKHIKNPISLARLVMEKSPHVMMAGEGAEKFAEENGVEMVDNSYFITEKRKKALERILEREKSKDQSMLEKWPNHKFGTVGCAALDKNGNLAAGTSTGGMTNKRWGRIGDSPVIGAGTYANNATCAISCTGHGEYFIRNVVAYDISALMEYKGLSLKAASNEVVLNKLVKKGGSGGVIAIDKFGNISTPFNTSGMFRGYMTDEGVPVVKIYKE